MKLFLERHRQVEFYILKVLEEDTKLKVPGVKYENITIYLLRDGWGIVTEDMPVEKKKRDYARM